MEIKLREYQRDGIRHLLSANEACLFYDPGLGKTLTTLLAYLLMKRVNPELKMLVFAPLRIAETVWQDEIAKWDDTQHLTTVLLHGSSKDRRFRVDVPEADITIINYEGIKWLTNKLKRKPNPWHIMCLDELSKCKDTGTQRHKFFRAIAPTFEYRWGLTGTPAPNSLRELFGQMLVIDGGRSLGKAKYKFEQLFFVPEYPGSYSMVPRKGAEEIIAKRIAPVVHDLRAVDHLKMPDRIDVWHDLKMEQSHQNIYDQMEEDSILEFAGSGAEVTALNAAVLWGKLQQITQGFLYAPLQDGGRTTEVFDSTKLDALEDIIEEASGNPVLVFYKFEADLERLKGRFPQARVLQRNNTAQIVRDWNEKKIPILFGNPQSAGHGLNLQAGGHIMVYYTLESSAERYIQANGRLHRQGQQSSVIIHHLNLSGTLDDDIRSVLDKRTTMQQRLRARISSLASDRVASLR